MSEQFALFENPASEPEGLRYAADFVSPETEQKLISRIRDLPLQPFQFGQFQGGRVASFGFRYDDALRRRQGAEPVPTWLDEIVAKVEVFGGPATRIRHVLCTEYGVGVGIGWHRDNLTPTEYSAFRWDPPANFDSVEPLAGHGTVSRSMPNLTRSA